jgi:hypothetical protein
MTPLKFAEVRQEEIPKLRSTRFSLDSHSSYGPWNPVGLETSRLPLFGPACVRNVEIGGSVRSPPHLLLPAVLSALDATKYEPVLGA